MRRAARPPPPRAAHPPPPRPPAVCTQLSTLPGADTTTFISIAAGVTIAQIQGWLGASRRVVRVMPNTPCLVGASAAGFACGATATAGDRVVTKSVFESVGVCHEVKEVLLNAVTGLSGSGPAYVYLMIEALADGGVRAGLPRAVALELAAQTVKGAASMVLETGKHPGELKDAVCSPGGTTIAGVAALEANGLRNAAISAVVASTKRSMQLGGLDPAESGL